ncbi:hypothetical protein [Spirosoma areae]
MTEQLYDNWGRAFTLPGVYSDFINFCRLVHLAPDGRRTPYPLQREPVGWANIRFTLKRGTLHGVNSEYSSSGSTLEFDQSSGREFVQSIFQVEGEDANLLFQFGLTIPELIDANSGIGTPGFEVIEYEGRVNLSLRKTEQRRVLAGLERNTLQSRVEARWDTSVNLSASRSLDNAPITPPTFGQIVLTPQSLDERFGCNLIGSNRVEQSFQGDTNGHVWIQFDTSQPQISEIEELAGGRPMGLSESDGPIANDEWLFKFRSAGTRQVKIEVAYNLWFTIKKRTVSVGKAKILGFRLDTFLTLIRADGTRQDWTITNPWAEGLGKRPPAGFAEEIVEVLATGKLDTSFETKPGDKLFLYGLLQFSHNKNELQQTQVVVQTKTQRITVSGKSTNNSSTARCLPIGEAINAALTVLTGLPDRFRSDFYGLQSARYGVNGCGARRVLFNGFAARQFKPLERPLAFSLQEAIQSLSAIDCVGLQYGHELDLNSKPQEIVSLKPIQEFYRPVELLRLDEVGDYSEDSLPTELYSTVEVGYQEWVSDGSNSLEEVFTTHQITTPIQHEAAKKTIISRFIASSLAIEKTRREQFTDTPKDGTAYDEKVFIVQCKPIPGFSGAGTFTRGFIANIIQLPTSLSWLAAGMKITIGGTSQNDGIYTVSFVADAGQRPWSFYVAEEVTNEVTTTLTIEPVPGSLELQPETGADFETVSGLQSPNDTYNLRLTPGRMLLQNAPVWAGCLINKDKFNLINQQPTTETGLIDVTFGHILFLNVITTDLYVPWLAAGMTVAISGNTPNVGTYTVVAVAAPDYSPWGFFVKEAIAGGFGSAVNIAFDSIGTDDLYAAVNKTRIPNNKSVVTELPALDACGKAGRVGESAPVRVDELITDLLYLPRLIRFKTRLSHSQIQRLRLGHSGYLPSEADANGDPIDPNYGYISLLNESGIRVAGFLHTLDYSRDNEEAIFELRQTALDLNDTTSGLDCGQFAGWTLEQAQAANERTRRRIEICRFIDVDPL